MKKTSENDNFFERVYEIVRQIPEGKVTSYGAIAKALGTARSARMVGWAMNASHTIDDVPAHRVVNRKGLLSGKHHFDGTNLMQQLLENEGVEVVDNQIVDFEKHFWKNNFLNFLFFEPIIVGSIKLRKATKRAHDNRFLQLFLKIQTHHHSYFPLEQVNSVEKKILSKVK